MMKEQSMKRQALALPPTITDVEMTEEKEV